MMHHVLRNSLTPPAVAGQLERGVRHHCLCICVVMNYAIVLLRLEQKSQIKKDAK